MLRLVICLSVTVTVLCGDVSFVNVTLMGGSKNVSIQSHDKIYQVVPERNIKEIYFAENDTIPVLYSDAITNLDQLERVDLASHGIEVVQRRAFYHLPALQELILDDNKIKEIKTGVFNELGNLSCLSLRMNQIQTVVEGAFDNLHNLSFLLLGSNKLVSFDPEWFRDKPFLFVVDLTQNSIKEIPDGAFEFFGEAMFLGDNQITNITHSMFGNGKRLHQLSLHDNLIESWDEDVFEDVKIYSLDLTQNQIRCLNGTLEELIVANFTSIGGNPWDCECLRNITKWAHDSAVSLGLGDSVEECGIEDLDVF